MYAHLKTYVSLTRAAFRAPRSFKRSGALLGAAVVHAFLFAINSLARLLDLLVYRRLGEVVVPEPVFVVATPRSGTTFLHHLLALDEKSFTHQKLYQTVFPSVLVDKLVNLLAPTGPSAKIPQLGTTRGSFGRIFRHWDGIHSVGLGAEEEDESLFVYMLHSPAFYLLMPFIDLAPEFQDLDAQGPRVRARVSACYRRTAQRHLLAVGANRPGHERTLLIKNVLLPSRFETTKQAFPDARFIRLVRDPRKAIPSAMSLFYAAWNVHSKDIAKDSHQTRCLGEMFLMHYRRLHEQSVGPDGKRMLTVFFEDLISDPLATVRRIYVFLGKELSQEYEEKLRSASLRPQRFKSKHSYSLEDFGWSERDVTVPLSDILEDLGLQPKVS